MMGGVLRTEGYRVPRFRTFAWSGLGVFALTLASCAPISTGDVIHPAGDDTLGGNVAEESPLQSWRAPTTPRDQLTTLFPFAAADYSFTADGALQQIEFIPAGGLSGPALFGGSFEVTHTLVPVGVDTEILRLTLDDGSGGTGEDRTSLLFAQGDLTIAADGTVTFGVNSTYRDELHTSHPLGATEDSLILTTLVQSVQIITGRLSEKWQHYCLVERNWRINLHRNASRISADGNHARDRSRV